jgi:hypothetical protein
VEELVEVEGMNRKTAEKVFAYFNVHNSTEVDNTEK